MSGQQQARKGHGGSPPASTPQRRSRTRRAPVPRPSFIVRNRGLILGLTAVVVIGALIVFAAVSANQPEQAATSATPASAAVVDSVTSIPSSTFDAVGAGTAASPPQAINALPLTEGGKPQFLYVGGEFCPFCAAERWPMVVALSRFGTFSGLSVTRSSPNDTYPNTATFSFYGSTYESPYLTFTPVELYSNERTATGYAPLQKLTPDQERLLDTYNADGGIPFLDFGGKYTLGGANYSPALLAGQDWDTIAAQLANPQSRDAQAIIGSANLLTAAICRITDGQPGDVCQAPGTAAAAALLK